MNTGTRVPRRMISMCGISRRPRSTRSSKLGRHRQGVTTRRAARREPAACDAGTRAVPSKSLAVEVLGGVSDDARAGAVAAIRGALRGHQHQHAIGIAVDQARHRGVLVLGQRVLHHRGEGLLLISQGHDLAADGVVRIAGSMRLMKYGVMSTRNLSGAPRPSRSFLGQLEDLCERLEVVDAVRELPLPVVPLLVGYVGVVRRAAAAGRCAIRAQGQCLGRAG